MEQDLVQTLTHAAGRRIADEAIAILRRLGKQAAIVTRSHLGRDVTRDCMDGAKEASLTIAGLKAIASAKTGKSTEEIRDGINDGVLTLGLLGIDKEQYVPWKGGRPVFTQEGVHLGGAGVSNLPEKEDDEVIREAIVNAGFRYEKPT